VKPAAPKGPNGETPAARAKRIAGVRDKSGKALGRLDDINGRWKLYRTQKVTPPGKGAKPRPPTPAEVTQRIIKEGFKTPELHLARLIREHKRFSPADVALAHRLGIRVPSELRPASGKPKKNNSTERGIDKNKLAGPRRLSTDARSRPSEHP
jgi:hypothetical protein